MKLIELKYEADYADYASDLKKFYFTKDLYDGFSDEYIIDLFKDSAEELGVNIETEFREIPERIDKSKASIFMLKIITHINNPKHRYINYVESQILKIIRKDSIYSYLTEISNGFEIVPTVYPIGWTTENKYLNED